MKPCKVDEKQLGYWIDQTTGKVCYIAPAITEDIARKIIDADRRTGKPSRVVVELNAHMDRCGYGVTNGVRLLFREGVSVEAIKGLRLAALVSSNLGVVWTPIPERIDSIEQTTVNGIRFDNSELSGLSRWLEGMTAHRITPRTEAEHNDSDADTDNSHETEPTTEPAAQLAPVTEKDIDEVDHELKVHPPRDFNKEKEIEVYQSYIGFIEIHLTGASLASKTTLAVPKELIELGLEKELRERLSESMRIDIRNRVDLGVNDVNKQVSAFREIFTKQMGQPLGRLYKKSDQTVMMEKWGEIQRLVEEANEKIEDSLEKTMKSIIKEISKQWESRINDIPSLKEEPDFNLCNLQKMFERQWTNRQRPTKVQLEVFFKDLTWETLNSEKVRSKINKHYPELRETGLYKSQTTWGPKQT